MYLQGVVLEYVLEYGIFCFCPGVLGFCTVNVLKCGLRKCCEQPDLEPCQTYWTINSLILTL